MTVIQRVGDQDVVLMDRLHRLSQEELILFVRGFRTALLSYNLYPPGHAVTHRRMSEFMQQLTPLFREEGVLVIACKREGLEVNDQLILHNVPEREVARELSSFLELRGVRNWIVHRGVSFREIEDLFTRWVTHQDPTTMHSAWKQGFQSSFLRFNMAVANRSEMVLNDGLSERPLEISREAILEAMGQSGVPQGDMSVVHGELMLEEEPLGFERPHSIPPRPVQVRPSAQGMPYNPSFSQPSSNHPPRGTSNIQGYMPSHTGMVDTHPHAAQHTPSRSFSSPSVERYPSGGPVGHHGAPHSSSYGYESAHLSGQPVPHPSAAHGHGRSSQGTPSVYSTQERAWGSDIGRSSFHRPEALHPNEDLRGHHPGAGIPGTGIPGASQNYGGVQYSSPSIQRGADLFSTGQFNPEMQAQLQAQQAQLQVQHQQAQQAQQAQQSMRGAGYESHTAPSGNRGADLFSTGQFRPFPQESIQEPPSFSSPSPAAFQSQSHNHPLPDNAQRGYGMPHSGPSGRMPSHSSDMQQPYGSPHSQAPSSSHPLSTSAQQAAFQTHERGRGADIFSTGQFNPTMQTQLRSEAEQAERDARNPIRLEKMTVDPQAFDQRPPPFMKLDYRQIDPVSLFQSKRFQEFLAKGGSAHYLSVYMSQQKREAEESYAFQPWTEMEGAKSLLKAVESLQHSKLKQHMLTQIARSLSSHDNEAVEEQVLAMGQSPSERFIRQELLSQTPAARVPELGQRLLRKMVRADNATDFDKAGMALQGLVDMQRKRNDWTPLIATLESLKQLRWDSRSEPWIRDSATQMLKKMVSARVGQQLLYQALCGEKVLREQARYGLVALGVDAAPIFIESLRQLQRRKDLESMLGLLQEVSQQLSTQQTRLFFGRLWADRAPLDDHQQIVLLKTMQKMAPDTLEKFLLKEIRFAEERNEEEVLLGCVRQAVLFHTPGLRQVLLDFLRTRRFALYSEIEEKILHIMEQYGTTPTVPLLDDMIHNTQLHMALRASAVWLLGSLKKTAALDLLSCVLLTRTRFLRKPKYAKELRLQAIDSLRHFQWDGVNPLLKRVKKDPDQEISTFAKQMLEDGRAFSFLPS